MMSMSMPTEDADQLAPEREEGLTSEEEAVSKGNSMDSDDVNSTDMSQVREVMGRLKEMTDYATQSCTVDLKVINKTILELPQRKSSTIEELVDLGLARLFSVMYKRSFHLDWTERKGSFLVVNIYLVASSMWNATDSSAVLCQQVVDMGLAADILTYLNDEKVQPDKLTENGIKFCVRPLLSILHNVVQKCDAARNAYRDANAIDILPKFRMVTDVETKCVVNFVLAYIVTDEENDKINDDDENIAFIIKMLSKVYDLKTEAKPHGFHTDEILQGLNKLANNDSNKVRIVRMGALPLYTKLLTIGDTREQQLAAQGIWQFAFRCKDIICQEPGCVAALQKLALSGDEEVSKDASGALWELGEHGDQTVIKTTEAKQSIACTDEGNKHIMISYQWSNQILMKRIRDRLKEAGYKIWMDVDNMSNSPVPAMAAAVEGAQVVLIAASRKYKESRSCRTEALYAYSMQRDIVPLIVETSYRPDGWLGPLVLNNLYFDFSKANIVFEKKMQDLIKELGSRGMASSKTKDKTTPVQKVVDTSTVHAEPQALNNHVDNDRGHGEDVIDDTCLPTIEKQPTPMTYPVTVLPPVEAYSSCGSCMCCFRPCHRHVKIHPEDQQRGAKAIHISWCCSTVDVEF